MWLSYIIVVSLNFTITTYTFYFAVPTDQVSYYIVKPEAFDEAFGCSISWQ
jgi:hypothetical protein